MLFRTLRLLLCCWLLSLGVGLLAADRTQAQTTSEERAYQQRMQQLFGKLDRNGDQRLQRQEVQGQAYLERHFERLDSRNRGYLTPEDLQPGEARSERFFSQADRNGDGRIDRREAEAHSWLQRHFKNADRNGDDTLDRQELRGLSEQRRR